MSTSNLPTIGGLVWYRAEDYLTLKQIFDDGHRLPETFESWLEQASHTEAMLQAKDIRTVRAYIDPKEFPQWCRARGMAIDAKARNEFANVVAQQAHQDGSV